MLAILIGVALVTTVIVVFTSSNKNNTNESSENSSTVGTNEESKKGSSNRVLTDNSIVQLTISRVYEKGMLVALTHSGEMHTIGVSPYDWLDSENEEPVLVASNVKKSIDVGEAYLDKNGDVYTDKTPMGLERDKFEKIGENMKDIAGKSKLMVAISNDGELYVYGNLFYATETYETLTKIEGATDVKKAGIYEYLIWYVTNSGELYARNIARKQREFEKVFDNVENTMGNVVAQLKDGTIYEIGVSTVSDYEVIEKEAYTKANGMKDFGNDFWRLTSNGVMLNGVSNSISAEGTFLPTDCKELIFTEDMIEKGSDDGIFYAYLNNDNKLCLHFVIYKGFKSYTKISEETEVMDYNIENLQKIKEFYYKCKEK